MDKPSISRSEFWRQRLLPKLRGVILFVLGTAAALIGLLIYHLLVPSPYQLTTNDVSTAVNQVLASATPPAPFSEDVYQIIQPSLVFIQSKIPGSDGKTDDNLGTGTIIDANGDILTSLHVVANATDIQVVFADGTTSTATVANQQSENDIAVLKADKLPAEVIPAVLGNPNAMHVGDEAYVVGNPYGLYSSMSAGVISGFNRTFQPTDSNLTLKSLIQIDAAVNPGNSGGPLLNRNGEVIGIVEGLVNPIDQNFFVGIGFAIPINVAGGAAGLPLD
ncbi:MAG: trypsin-like peptidase domain-containing protein [Anaerolineales bacterium]|jgi:S1-C subfamily serine protease